MARPRHPNKDIEAAVIGFRELDALESRQSCSPYPAGGGRMHTQKDGLMATYHFTLEVSGIDPDVEGFEDRFYGNGVEDALIYVSDRRLFLAFDREAASE